MNIKSLVILIAFVLIGAGAYFYSSAKQSINAADNIGAAILPGLEAALNDIEELEVITAGNEVLATITRSTTGWVVKQRNGYPADISKVRAVLLNLAQAKIVEEKTSNQELYAKLGVEDISTKDAQSVKAVVKYTNQRAELIVGKPGPQINKSRYVRLANSDTSWLIDQKIDLKHQPDYWLKKDILSIEPSDVAAVKITLQEDGAILDIANSDDENNTFTVTNLTDPNSQVIEAELHQVTNALSSFQLLDVASADQLVDTPSSMTVDYQLKSGATINLVAYDIEDAHYASIQASVNEDVSGENNAQAQEYVEQINKVTSGWVYKIPNVTYDSMFKREPDVLAITEDQLN